MTLRIRFGISTLLVGVFLCLGTHAFAAPGAYSALGAGRTWTGNLLVLPIAGSATGSGPVVMDPAINGGKGPITISQNIIDRDAVPSVIGLWQAGGKAAGDVLSVRTGLDVQLPGVPDGGMPRQIQFGPGLRSGPATFMFCPGATQPGKTVFNGTAAGFNPNCTDPLSEQTVSSVPTGGSGIANGILTYTATSNQFGGLSSLRVRGAVNLAIMFAPCVPNVTTAPGGIPCGTNAGLFVDATSYLDGTGEPQPIDAPVNPLQWQNVLVKYLTGYTYNGIVTGLGATLLPGGSVTNSGWGGPLTTGSVMMNVTNNAGPSPLTFTVQGYDNRDSNGIGRLQMVTGSVSQLTSSQGTNGSASRSRVTIEITPEPTMLLGASGAFVALLVSHTFVRRRSPKS